MNDMEVRKRLKWMRVYQKVSNAGGYLLAIEISRPMLRKWLRCFETEGIAGLKSCSHRSHRIRRKVSQKKVVTVLPMRKDSKLGHPVHTK